MINSFEICGESLTVFPRYILQTVADLVDNAALNFGLRKNCVDCMGMYRKVCKWLKLGTGLQSEWQAG